MTDTQQFTRISRITLSGLLPRVFRGEKVASEVWERSLTLCAGERVLIEAASGSGKTSLCSFIMGERTDYDGSITFTLPADSLPAQTLPAASLGIDRWCALRRSALAYLPQELCLFSELSVMDNLRLKNGLTNFYTEKELLALLAELGLEQKAAEPAGRLSVGQQQRVALIRALCQPFSFLLLDEPVSHLDAPNNAAAAALVEREAARRGAAVVVTSVGNPLSLTYSRTLSL